ncbi:MAG: zinc ABC transporter substrate-binding protein [Candidatus Thermofonsia bacterium]|nr:MAG: zinc ABC transporter substrate-binding protein [Candidatus Thermofonsia bacterium]
MFFRWIRPLLGLAAVLLLLNGCGGETAVSPDTDELTLPTVEPVQLDGEKLQVVATTSIIGDVVGQVGGDAIQLKTLLQPGQDPHSYQPTSGDLAAVADAHIIFVNGWNLEERLLKDITAVAENGIIVPVNAGVTPLSVSGTGDNHDHEETHGTVDPHSWLDVASVQQWVSNIAQVLETADPPNAPLYQQNAATYQNQLSQLQADMQTQLSAIPQEKRVLVTNHDALGYFARAYGFRIVGTIIPGKSTLAEPSSADITQLVSTMAAQQICTIFVESTVNTSLAETVANELPACDKVSIKTLYTGALGPAGSGADSYLGMMRANVQAIVEGLNN